jgi:hypothetical protein
MMRGTAFPADEIDEWIFRSRAIADREEALRRRRDEALS